jgi:hypothetical protein
LISAQKKAKETGSVDSNFLNNPNISQKAKNKVIRLAKQRTKDFVNYDNVDNDEFFEIVASNYGLNTNKYWSAHASYKKFYSMNRKSIEKGRKLVNKMMK